MNPASKTAPALLLNPAPAASLLQPAFVRLMAMQVAFGLSFSIFLILPKHLAVTLHAGPAAIGWIMSMYGVANILFARPIAAFVQRVGRKRALQAGALCATLGSSLFVFADTAGVLAASGRLLQGVAWALVFTAGTAMAAELAPVGRMAHAMGVFASAVLAMNAIGPPLAEPMLTAWGHRPVFALASMASFVAFFLARRLPAQTAAASDTPAMRTRSPLPRAYLALWVVLGVACGTMFTFYQALAIDAHVPRVSDFLLGYTAAALLVRVFGGRFVDRIGYRTTCLWTFVLYGFVVFAMRWMGPHTIVILGACFGAAHGTFYPAMMALSVVTVPPQARSALMSTINVAYHSGAMAVVALGYAATYIGFEAIFALAAMVTLLSLGWLRPRPS